MAPDGLGAEPDGGAVDLSGGPDAGVKRTYPVLAPHSLCTAQACSRRRRLEDKEQRNHGEGSVAGEPPRPQPTGHVHHPAVAVLHDVARLAVDPAGRHAVDVEKAQGPGLALSPGGGEVGQLWGRGDVGVSEGARMRRAEPGEEDEDLGYGRK